MQHHTYDDHGPISVSEVLCVHVGNFNTILCLSKYLFFSSFYRGVMTQIPLGRPHIFVAAERRTEHPGLFTSSSLCLQVSMLLCGGAFVRKHIMQGK